MTKWLRFGKTYEFSRSGDVVTLDTCSSRYLTLPGLTTAKRIFLSHRYFRYFRLHAETNPLVAKWYMEKAPNRAVTGYSPGRKQTAQFPALTQGLNLNKSAGRPMNFVNDVQPN